MHRRRYPAALVVSALVGSLTVAPVSLAAKRRPDLIVTAMEVTSTVVPTGTKIRVTDTVKNRGSAPAGASRNSYLLSADEVVGSDIKLAGSRKVKKLRPRRSSAGTVQVKVPASVTPGVYHLVVCADGARKVAESKERNNCRVGNEIKVLAASDHDLIDQALRSGDIDAETAIVYRVFSDFGDPRLPNRFRGDNSRSFENDTLSVVGRDFDSYSAETRAILEPFLIPPFHYGSWWDIAANPSPEPPAALARATTAQGIDDIRCNRAHPDELPNHVQWGHVDAAGGTIRIWWQKSLQTTDEPLAEQMAAEIDAHIWRELMVSMGYAQPLGDDGGSPFVTCRGGTDAYDISLVTIPRSNTYTINPRCDGTWAATLFNRNQPPADVPEVLAHEIFHAVQFRYDVKNGCLGDGSEYGWWKEATAQWVEDALYPSGNREHSFAERMLDQPWLSVDDPGAFPGNDRFYGEYLIPFMLSRTGRRGTIKQIWDNTTSMSMSDAFKAPFGTDFDQFWKDFTVHNFNRGEFNHYEDWDGLTKRAKLTGNLNVPKGEFPMTVAVDALAAKYITFTPTTDLTSLRFENDSLGVQGVGIQALIEYADGTWKKEDWSGESVVDLCLRDPNVKSVTLVFSNSNTDHSIPPIAVKWTGQKDLCCSGNDAPAPRGAKVRQGAVDDGCAITGSITYKEIIASSNEQSTLTVKIDIRMKPYGDGIPGYDDDGSSYTWTYSGSFNGREFDCDVSSTETGEGGGTINVRAGKLIEVGDFNIDAEKAQTRELLVGVPRRDYEFETKKTTTHSGCGNPSHNGTITGMEIVYFHAKVFSDINDCSTGDGQGSTRFVGANPEATTLMVECRASRPDENTEETIIGHVGIG